MKRAAWTLSIMLGAATTAPTSASMCSSLYSQLANQDIRRPHNGIGPETFTLDPKYIGEKSGKSAYLNSYLGQENERVYVRYFDDVYDFVAHSKNGKLANVYGNQLNHTVTLADPPESYPIYVLNGLKEFVVHEFPKRGQIHHSSIANGKDVYGAGRSLIKNGELLYIDNFSGHYHPGPEGIVQTLEQLSLNGVELNKVRVVFYFSPEKLVTPKQLPPTILSRLERLGIKLESVECKAVSITKKSLKNDPYYFPNTSPTRPNRPPIVHPEIPSDSFYLDFH